MSNQKLTIKQRLAALDEHAESLLGHLRAVEEIETRESAAYQRRQEQIKSTKEIIVGAQRILEVIRQTLVNNDD